MKLLQKLLSETEYHLKELSKSENKWRAIIDFLDDTSSYSAVIRAAFAIYVSD